MNIKERIKDLCRQKGITVNKLETELGFGTGYVSKLDKSTPNSKYIQKLADYFNVSVDYLMTGGKREVIIETAKLDDSISNASDRLKEYFAKLAKLPTEQQEHIISLIDMLNKNNK